MCVCAYAHARSYTGADEPLAGSFAEAELFLVETKSQFSCAACDFLFLYVTSKGLPLLNRLVSRGLVWSRSVVCFVLCLWQRFPRVFFWVFYFYFVLSPACKDLVSATRDRKLNTFIQVSVVHPAEHILTRYSSTEIVEVRVFLIQLMCWLMNCSFLP